MSELVSLTVPDSIQEFPLNEDSVVFIVGAWEGKHAQYFIDRYNPNMFLFEPQKIRAKLLKEKFAGNLKVKVFCFGLGEMSTRLELSRVGTDRCSFIHRLEGMDLGEGDFEGPHARARIMEVGEFMGQERLSGIDLILMNCEGYEFRLLPWICQTKIINRCQYLMVQFHMHHEGSDRMEEIKKMMVRTHRIRDDYEPAWIVWEKKKKRELIYGHKGLQTYRTAEGILQVVNKVHGDDKYEINLKGIKNAAAKMKLLEGSGFTPKLLRETKQSIIQEDLGLSEGVENFSTDDWQDFRRHLTRALITLRQKRIRHGDLNGNNIIIKNKKPYIIDWQESHTIGTKPPQQMPMHDTCWLFGNIVRWIGNPVKSDPYRVCRRWNHINGDLMGGADCSLPLEGKALLDVGCFQGDFSAMAAAELMKVTGIDPGGFRSGEDSIEIGKELWKGVDNLTLIQMDVVDWPNFNYDIVLFMDTFPYVVRDHGKERAIEILNKMVKEEYGPTSRPRISLVVGYSLSMIPILWPRYSPT